MTLSSYLSRPFVEQMMRQYAPEKDIRVVHCQSFEIDSSASILAALTAGSSDTMIGHFGLAVTFSSPGAGPQTRHMALKVKPHGREIVAMLQRLASACGGPLAEVYPAFSEQTGFRNTHMRELEVYGKLATGLCPEIFGIYADPAHATCLILMEYLEDVTLMNSVMAPETWSDGHICQALDQVAAWHARHLDRVLPIDPTYWTDALTTDRMVEMMPLWAALLANAAGKFPDLYLPGRVAQMEAIIGQIPDYWPALEKIPKTLVHNDLNPRNSCFKTVDGLPVFCAYDWELATWHVPQYDVVELLCFVLDEDRYPLRLTYLEHYRKALHQHTGRYADATAFRRGFELAAFDFGLHRLGMYMMAHSVGPYPFLPRVVNSYFDTLAQLGD